MWASDEVALEGPGDPEEGWMTCSLLFSFSGKLLSQIGGTGGGGWGRGGGTGTLERQAEHQQTGVPAAGAGGRRIRKEGESSFVRVLINPKKYKENFSLKKMT